MCLAMASDMEEALCFLDALSCHLDVFSDRSARNSRVLEEQDAQISCAAGASQKHGHKSAELVQNASFWFLHPSTLLFPQLLFISYQVFRERAKPRIGRSIWLLKNVLRLQMYFGTAVHDGHILKSLHWMKLEPPCSVKAASCNCVKQSADVLWMYKEDYISPQLHCHQQR